MSGIVTDNVDNGLNRLTGKHRKAIELLLGGTPHIEVAARLGVNIKTISRWLADPIFRSELDSRMEEGLYTATIRLSSGLDTILTELETLITDRTVNERVRLNAIQTFLDTLLKLRDAIYVDEKVKAFIARIEKLEIGYVEKG